MGEKPLELTICQGTANKKAPRKGLQLLPALRALQKQLCK
jgi:hypothetical protein